MLELFDKYSLIIIPMDSKIKVFLTSKDKSNTGSYEITRQLVEFKKLLRDKITFIHGKIDEIILYD
jgi:hypothetical protein